MPAKEELKNNYSYKKTLIMLTLIPDADLKINIGNLFYKYF
jgi:hypothetical protein